MIQFSTLVLLFLSGTTNVFSEIEIDLDEAAKPTSTPVVKHTPTPANASHKQPVFTPTATFTQMKKASGPIDNPPTLTPTPENEPVEKEVAAGEEESKPVVVRGTWKMKNFYEAGIKANKEKRYDDAIKYLTKAVKMKDKHTPNYYYSEAYATLGIIYQYHIIRYKTAYGYYKKALAYEYDNPTAKKHLKQVKKLLKKKRK